MYECLLFYQTGNSLGNHAHLLCGNALARFGILAVPTRLDTHLTNQQLLEPGQAG